MGDIDELYGEFYGCQPIEIGGWNRVAEGAAFFNPASGRLQMLHDDIEVLPIPTERLCGLVPILDDLWKDCGVEFVGEAVFYKPKPVKRSPAPRADDIDLDGEIPY